MIFHSNGEKISRTEIVRIVIKLSVFHLRSEIYDCLILSDGLKIVEDILLLYTTVLFENSCGS
jgi:hypothetical protein